MGKVRRITLTVEVPERLVEGLDEESAARRIKAFVEAELEERLRLLALADKLIPDSEITEEEILEIDRVIKRRIAERLERELGLEGSG